MQGFAAPVWRVALLCPEVPQGRRRICALRDYLAKQLFVETLRALVAKVKLRRFRGESAPRRLGGLPRRPGGHHRRAR
jgi:hypothetical protein